MSPMFTMIYEVNKSQILFDEFVIKSMIRTFITYTHIRLNLKMNGITNGIHGPGVSLYARYIILQCSLNTVATCV